MSKTAKRIRTLKLVGPGQQKNGQTVTRQHLQQVVKNYQDDVRPPVTLGHPSKGADQQKAFGRGAKPRIENVDGVDSLVVDIHYSPELAESEDSGDFEGFSGGIYPHPKTGEYYLHHIAALGGLPPAADTKTLEVVELAAVDNDKLICLAAEPIKHNTGEITLDEEALKETISAAVIAATKPLQDRLDALEKPATAPAAAKPASDSAPAEQQAAPAENKELSALLEVTKGDRLQNLKTAAATKGLSDAQCKPLFDRLEQAPAIELANNEPAGLYLSTLTFINGLTAPADNPLGQPLELAAAVDGQESINLGELANKI
jgi:hypothetical protein